MEPRRERDGVILRYTLGERILHWVVALSFLYLLLTGLALFYPPFYWLVGLFGGGAVIRYWHPVVGVIFFGALVVMLLLWARDMRIEPHDREWLRHMGDYAAGREEAVPPSGRFNAGQKLLFYLQFLAGILLLLSGVVLWFPLSFGRVVRQASFVVHDLAAIAAMGGLILHVYMGVFVIRGSWEAITRGTVSRRWAEAHHGLWFRQLWTVGSRSQE
ncbi:MAG: formate dehydrogenase subunit gamma [Armatimonadota bacterium]|nr:formate dehydrogenase subunit gamma [Armatimonadota bacterium]MDR7568058.1 formate dehydrogenase subunit gamma [Armatimonadota bacterium]